LKLGLGTVQFGLDYGLSNVSGRTQPNEVQLILKTALENDIRVLDTAAQYGSSEEVIGMTLNGQDNFQIVTKTPIFRKNSIQEEDGLALRKVFMASLQKLKQTKVYGLLVHHANDLLASRGETLWAVMQDLKNCGLIQKIGVSVYEGEQIDALVKRFRMDMIQVPINILDQRLWKSGRLRRLKEAGVEVHARSVFMQGLLLMDPEKLEPYFSPIKSHLVKLGEYLSSRNVTPQQAALGFVRKLKEIDVILVGVNNQQQLMQLCSEPSSPLETEELLTFSIEDPALLNPSAWRLK